MKAPSCSFLYSFVHLQYVILIYLYLSAPCHRCIESVPDIPAASLSEDELLRNRVIPSIVPMTSGVFRRPGRPALQVHAVEEIS